MKRIFRIILATFCISLLICCNVFASYRPAERTDVKFETVYINGESFYLETYITGSSHDDMTETLSIKKSGSITRTKTSNIYNSSGQIMISVSITGTFTYNGSTAFCTSCYGSSKSYHSAWQIYDYVISRSGNTATNYTTAKQIIYDEIYTYHKSVTITCDPDGTIS